GSRSNELDLYGNFDGWVQHIQHTCHPDPNEDLEDDDHLPSRPQQLTDQSFTKVLKMKKATGAGHPYKNGARIPPPGAIPSSVPNVDITSGDVIVVSKDGSGDFSSVQAAIDSVPQQNTKRVVIYVKRGVYREKVVIPSSKPFITLKGENSALTYIQWDDNASTLGSDGKALGTYGSASVAVQADDFMALDISFKKCHLHSIATPDGALTAQDRLQLSENTGYSFAYCTVTGTGTICLGRAWGADSRVVYAFTYFDNIILPQGWNDWGLATNQQTVFYGEYKCFGPGANTSGRVQWSKQLTPEQAQPFLSIAFIDGNQWLTTN
ncbi:hypothetical protein KP509_15G045300, partial [Ceratopteris richardii]